MKLAPSSKSKLYIVFQSERSTTKPACRSILCKEHVNSRALRTEKCNVEGYHRRTLKVAYFRVFSLELRHEMCLQFRINGIDHNPALPCPNLSPSVLFTRSGCVPSTAAPAVVAAVEASNETFGEVLKHEPRRVSPGFGGRWSRHS
jgi:hypothetical protein